MCALPAANIMLSAYLISEVGLSAHPMCLHVQHLPGRSIMQLLFELSLSELLTHSLTDLSSHVAITRHGWHSRAILLQGLLSPLEVHLAWLGPHHHGLKVRLWKGIYQLKLKAL